MNVNATLLIQAINFFIVYWLLRTLLFKPVISVIDSELSHKASLFELIGNKKKNIAAQEKEHERLWSVCRQYCRAHSPDIMYQQIRVVVSPPEMVTAALSHEEQEVVSDIYKRLEEKIKDVH